MAQLVVRNLPDEVKERLKRRAKQHGRSLEAEARAVLERVPDTDVLTDTTGRTWVEAHVEALRQIGITNEDVDALEKSIAESRRQRREREIDFGQ